MVTKIGFVGLGVMGKRMAKNLTKAGYVLVVHNRSAPAVEEMVKFGAMAAVSPAALARDCEIVLLSLPSAVEVKDVVLGKNGLVHGLSAGSIVIDTSTIDPAAAVEIASELRDRWSYFLDAPVSGGPEGADAATLSIMVGGEAQAFERCKPILETLGRSVFYLGDSGSGQKMKLVNQALCGGYFLVVADAYRLSKKLNVREERMLEVISRSWGDSPVFRHFLSVVKAGKYEDGAGIHLYEKDLSVISEVASKQDMPIPIIESVRRYFMKASELGYSAYDASYMHLLLESISSSK